jgi:hypothetical protein
MENKYKITVELNLNKKLRRKLDKCRSENYMSISEIIIKSLNKYFNIKKSAYQTKMADDESIIQNCKFIELFFWLMDKAIDPVNHESDKFLVDILIKIDQVVKSPKFTQKLKDQLLNVNFEIVEHLTGNKVNIFEFPLIKDGFDYDLLRKEFYCMELNDPNQED